MTDRISPNELFSLVFLSFLIAATSFLVTPGALLQRLSFSAPLLRAEAIDIVPVKRPLRLAEFDATPYVVAAEERMSPKDLLGRWKHNVSEAAKRFSVPEQWIRAVIRQESGGRTMLNGKPIVSSAGAIGVMQLMPGTYDEMRSEHALGADPTKARDNIFAGTAYLKWLHHKYGYPKMFAAYNAGPGRLEQHLYQGAVLPTETQNYLKGVVSYVEATGPAQRKAKRKMAKARVTHSVQPG